VSGQFRLITFGLCELAGPNGVVDLGSKKALGLLVFLATNRLQAHPRERLSNLLWGSHFEAQARQNLRQALFQLRRALGPDSVTSSGELVSLKANISTDAAEFETLIRDGNRQALEQAIALYRGGFLADVDISEDTWRDWASNERQRLESLALTAMIRFAEGELDHHNPNIALDAVERVISINNLREDAHRLKIAALADVGRKAEALKHYENLVELLKRELSVEPDIATQQLAANIKLDQPTGSPVHERATGENTRADPPKNVANGRPATNSAPSSQSTERLGPDDWVDLLNIYRERERAIIDIFARINSGVGDLKDTFRAVIGHALRLCNANFGMLLLFREEAFTYAAGVNVPAAFEDWCCGRALQADPRTGLGQVQQKRKLVHILDVRGEDIYREGNALRIATADLAGARTFMAIPIVSEGRLLGAMTIYRQEVRPFERAQIELVQAFALEAALALTNAQLVKDLDSRRRELAELNAALEQRVGQQMSQLEKYSRFRRFVPPQLADLMMSDDPDRYLQSHRREVAVLACDLRGFSNVSESMEPEVAMDVLKTYHACIGNLAESFEATIERFAGDRVVMVFNDPMPSPNAPEQAVRMGVALRDRIAQAAQTWRGIDIDVALRIGIAFGYATLGQIGFEGRYEYAAIGPVPILASRLCDHAADWRIVVTQRVLTAIQDTVEAESLGDLQLEGFTRSIRASNILRLREGARN